MSGISSIVIILLVVALIAVIISIVAYNRRLDRVTSGEIHDTHSSIPEPGTTTGVAYRIVLMAIVIISFFSISAINGKLNSLQTEINNMQSKQSSLSTELYQLRTQLEQAASNIQSSSWEYVEADYANRTITIRYSATLKEYSNDMTVSLVFKDREIPLELHSPGTWGSDIIVSFFDTFYEQPMLYITENGKTVGEAVDFLTDPLWYALPMPSLSCEFSSGERFGKLTYSGRYTVMIDYLEDIESVTVTYMTGGKDLKTLDITEETLNRTQIEVEGGMELDQDLTFRIEIKTKSGFTIVQQGVMIYNTTADYPLDDYERVYDSDGNLLWENDFK